jgi:hypothetical protein
MRRTKVSDNGTEQSFDRGLFIGIKLTSSFILTFEFVMDEGIDTTPGPPWDTGEEDDRSTPMSPRNTGATDGDPGNE